MPEASSNEQPPDLAACTFREALSLPLRSARRLGGGRNSRVWLIHDGQGQAYVLKHYFTSPSDPRDRLGTEFAALQLMHRHGITCVPVPLHRDDQCQFALYSCLSGTPAANSAITAHHIDDTVNLLLRLRNIAGTIASGAADDWSQLASESCPSPRLLLDNLALRVARLIDIESHYPDLAEFLSRWRAVRRTAEARLRASDIPFETPLPRTSMTLSPSDFGPHNAVVGDDGHLAFCDFEYFGLDDPAKMVCDFLLHPGYELSAPLRAHFLQALLTAWPDAQRLRHRIHLLYAFYALKWCLILLNEYLRTDRARRDFASASRDQDRLAQQLHKANRMLALAESPVIFS